jgi:cytochrome c biogenesis protein CcmG, thiol:disulfide interchange protein DsbE
MRNKIVVTTVIILFLVIFLIFYKGLQNSNIYTPNTSIKKDIPSFEIKIFDTNKIVNSESIFKNDKFYLINIWASWCVPCRDEHSFLMNLSKQKNVEMIGINYKDQAQNAKIFLKELGNPYKTIFLDKDGTIAIEWGAYGVPETFLIQNKKIIKKIIGPINKETLLQIKKLIK